jgi:hypothetical protein
VPGTTLEVFEQAGHFPHLTEPARLAGRLGRWMRDDPAVQMDPSTLTSRAASAGRELGLRPTSPAGRGPHAA